MDAYILCPAPPFGQMHQWSLASLRVGQLAAQARRQFECVRLVLPLSAYERLVGGSLVAEDISLSGEILLIDDALLATYFGRLAPSVVVLTRPLVAAFDPDIARRHDTIVDLFPCDIAPDRVLSDAEGQGLDALGELARRWLVHTPSAAEALKTRVDASAIVVNPFAPNLGESSATTGGDFVLVLANGPHDARMLEAVTMALAERTDIRAILLCPPKPHEDPASRLISIVDNLPNVQRLDGLTAAAHLDVLQSASAIIDCTAPSRDSGPSPWPSIAVRAGTPVLARAHADLEARWPRFPGLLQTTEPEAGDIAAFIDSAAEGTYRAALLEAQDDLDAVLRDPAIFGGWS